ncbi:MAG: amino acid permease, partial [Gemmatimonadetes bacterium]|nr:amino acid permease [Gemmatimonadota bacterium]
MNATKPETRTLPRTLRLRDLIPIVVGSVIGSGIFLVPGTVLRQAEGDAGVALLVWLLGGVLSLMGALTYGELGAMNPEAGGLYIYLRDAFGAFVAFVFGWSLFFVIASGAAATLAVAFSFYLQQYVELGPAAAKLASVLMIAVVAALNVRGTRQSAGVQNWSTAIKVAALLAMSIVLLVAGAGLPATRERFFATPVSAELVSGMGLAMIGVLWAYEGWQFVTYSAGETLDAQRTFPRGIAIGTAALIGIYLFANVGYLAALGPAATAGSQRVAADAMGQLLGPAAAQVVAAPILVSIFSAANGITLTAPRVYYAMARDGLFFRRLADVHPRFGTPAAAVVTSSAWAMVLAATGTFEQLLTYVVFAGWIFYGLGAAAVF